jgi:hypothetical protein
MTKLHSIYAIILNNETEFITEILEEMETWIFQNIGIRTSIGQRSFKYRGTKIWNGLDTELKSISDLNNFKTKLKTILIEKRCPSSLSF